MSRETPDETLDRAAEELRTILEAGVLARVHNADPAFFDRAVDRLYRSAGFASERERVEHLFML